MTEEVDMTTMEVSGEGLCWVIGSMGSGVDGVKVGRSIGRALELGAVAAGRSEVVGVWGDSGKPFIFGSSIVWYRRINRDCNPLVLVILGQHGRQKWGQKRGARWRQRERHLRVATTLAKSRALESESAAAISVSEGVRVGEGSGRGCRRQGQSQQGSRRQGRQRWLCYVTCVVSGSEDVSGVTLAPARALSASGL